MQLCRFSDRIWFEVKHSSSSWIEVGNIVSMMLQIPMVEYLCGIRKIPFLLNCNVQIKNKVHFGVWNSEENSVSLCRNILCKLYWLLVWCKPLSTLSLTKKCLIEWTASKIKKNVIWNSSFCLTEKRMGCQNLVDKDCGWDWATCFILEWRMILRWLLIVFRCFFGN